MGAAVKRVSGGQKVRQQPRAKRIVGSPLDKAKGSEINWRQVPQVFEAVRGGEGYSFVYFIGEEDEGCVKIGVAKDPIARLRQMQTGNPRRLCVERLLIGDMNLEKLLHELWGKYAIPAVPSLKSRDPDAPPGTEWFREKIRAELYPIVETAVPEQIAYVRSRRDDVVTPEGMERIVREAHGAHGVVAFVPHQVHFLARHAGYVTPRRSRII